jgi:hypothetical protein
MNRWRIKRGRLIDRGFQRIERGCGKDQLVDLKHLTEGDWDWSSSDSIRS